MWCSRSPRATGAGVAGTGAIGSACSCRCPAGTAAANDGRVFPGRPAGALPAHCYPPLALPTAATQAPRPWTTPPSATGSMLRRPFTPRKVVDNSAPHRLLRRNRYALRLCFGCLSETPKNMFKPSLLRRLSKQIRSYVAKGS